MFTTDLVNLYNKNIFKTSLYIYIFQDGKCRLMRNLSLSMGSAKLKFKANWSFGVPKLSSDRYTQIYLWLGHTKKQSLNQRLITTMHMYICIDIFHFIEHKTKLAMVKESYRKMFLEIKTTVKSPNFLRTKCHWNTFPKDLPKRQLPKQQLPKG